MPQESGLPAGSRSKAGVTPASTNAVPPRGLMFGLIAYGLWGMFPLYFPLLEPAGAIEILAHRMLWSLLISSIILTVVRGWRAIVTMPPRVWGLVVAAAILILTGMIVPVMRFGIQRQREVELKEALREYTADRLVMLQSDDTREVQRRLAQVPALQDRIWKAGLEGTADSPQLALLVLRLL